MAVGTDWFLSGAHVTPCYARLEAEQPSGIRRPKTLGRAELVSGDGNHNHLAHIAAALPGLHTRAMGRLTAGQDRSRSPVHIYLALLDEARRLNVSSSGPEACDFRRTFNGYYGVRRNEAWRALFYREFEAAKQLATAPATIFAQVLAEIEKRTGRVEASFTSKLVATLHPQSAVLDSVVGGFLTRRLGSAPAGKGLDAAVAFYEWLNQVMLALAETSQAAGWFLAFDEQFASVRGASGIAKMKKLDFLIWGGADR